MIVPEEDVVRYCADVLDITIDLAALRRLTALNILPALRYRGSVAYLKADIDIVVRTCSLREREHPFSRQASLFDVVSSSRLIVNRHTTLDLPTVQTSGAYYGAIRSIMTVPLDEDLDQATTWRDEPFFTPTRLSTKSDVVYEMAASQVLREESVLASKATDFANSADYMGSKRAIAPFLVEALTQVATPDTILVDLMCGSGAVAGALSRQWKVIASDAQDFSRYLAIVQGGGFHRSDADVTLRAVIGRAQEHARALSNTLHPYLEQENALFHQDAGPTLRDAYSEFVGTFPILGRGRFDPVWNPTKEVDLRQGDPLMEPYVLFTTHFANIYFGLRQAVEIDSLRYAIEGLTGPQRSWALGALIASASKVSTNYGGHFAQPRVRNWQNVSISELSRIIEQRSRSVFHEFAVRLMNLADESSRRLYPVNTVDGPWQGAIETLAKRCANSEHIVVYLDPPYRRDEYSRYYHVLETLVKYNYPGVEGAGRTPPRGGVNRFASEFATRKPRAKLQAIVSVIETILSHGWTCAWSYADVGDVEIPEVLTNVSKSLSFDAWSVSAPHRHQSHRGRGLRDVTEYVVFLRPS